VRDAAQFGKWVSKIRRSRAGEDGREKESVTYQRPEGDSDG